MKAQRISNLRTNSTGSPDTMTQPAYGTDRGFPASIRLSSLLDELKLCVEASLKAILNRDVAELQKTTDEQKRLCDLISAQFPPEGSPQNTIRGKAGATTALDTALHLRAASLRILQLCRVQRAVTIRAERSITLLSHWLVAFGANYDACGYTQNKRHIPATTVTSSQLENRTWRA